MNTHRRAWTLRASVVTALVAGALTVIAAPAAADDPDVQINGPGDTTVQPGQRVAMQFTVRNNNEETTSFAIRVETFDGLACQGECSISGEQIQGGQTESFEVTLFGGNVPPGQNRAGQVRVTAQSENDSGDSDSTSRQFTVQAPQPEQPEVKSVKKVSGQIVDITSGDPIPGAIVAMRDSEDREFSTEANDKGRFTFNGSEQRPIAPGRVSIAVGKNGYDDIAKNFELKAGQSKTDIRIPLTSTASPTPSAAPEESVPAAAEGASPGADANQVATEPTAGEDSGGALFWVMILAGGLLVALGVGALVLLLVRRKQDKDDEGGAGVPGGPRVGPGGRGGYADAADETRVVSPVGMGMGPGRGTDPTMMARSGLAEAPTQLHAPVRDEFADPYGAPPVVRQVGADRDYGAGPAGPQPGWAGAGYADATQVGGYPGASAGPGSPAGPGPGYGGPAGPAFGSPPGYGPDGGPAAPYGSPVVPRPGYGGPGGYEAPNAEPVGARGGGFAAGDDYGQPGRGRDAREFGDRYDEPTGRFRGQDAGTPNGRGHSQGHGGYGAADGAPPPYESGYAEPGYAPPSPSYDQRDGYEPPASYGRRGGGYEPDYGGRPSYDQPAGYAAPGGYDQAPGGYDRPPAYDPAPDGYDRPPAYDPPPAGYDPPPGGYPGQRGQGYDQRGGYGADRGYEPRGYDQGGYPDEPGGRDPGPHPSRHAAPSERTPGRGERRPLDWLDD